MNSPSTSHTILVVEDDPNDMILIDRALKKAKVINPIQIARNGDEAVEYLKGEGSYTDRNKHPLPTLILLDLKLPRRSGLEVLEWLKTENYLKRIPVVVLTSSRESTDVNKAYDLGVNSYLLKPVTPEGLMEVVHNINLYWLLMNVASDVPGR